MKIYVEKEEQMGDHWYSICVDNIGKKYQQWIVPCRILNITPAEYARLLVEEYHAILRWCPDSNFLSRKWANLDDERRWRLFINKKARETGFRI